MSQGYSRYSLRETLHFGADFPGLDNKDCVGDARRPDEAMVVAVTAACAFSARKESNMIAAHIEPILIVTGAVTAIVLINLLAALRSL